MANSMQWRFAVFTPRDLFIFGRIRTVRTNSGQKIPDCYEFVAANPVPPVFHACFDARRVAKNHYKRVALHTHASAPRSPKAYCHPDFDRLCPFPCPGTPLDNWTPMMLLSKLLRRYKIKRVAFQHQDSDRASSWTKAIGTKTMKDWITSFLLTRGVEEITLFTCDGDFAPKRSNTATGKLVDHEEIWIDSCKVRRLLLFKTGFMKARKAGLEEHRRIHGGDGGPDNGTDEPLKFACLFPHDKLQELLASEKFRV